jgi:hypothetical protein
MAYRRQKKGGFPFLEGEAAFKWVFLPLRLDRQQHSNKGIKGDRVYKSDSRSGLGNHKYEPYHTWVGRFHNR